MKALTRIEQQLTDRWGMFSSGGDARSNGRIPYMKNGLAFNYFFSPVAISEVEQQYGCKLPEELCELYSACNGLRLFLSGLSIFGIQSRKETMEPFSITTENYNIHARMREHNCDNQRLVFIGSVGKDAVFAFNQDHPNSYICMKNGYSDILLTFQCLDELMQFFVPKIMDIYNDNFKKKSPNEKYKGIPVLENSLLSIDEIL